MIKFNFEFIAAQRSSSSHSFIALESFHTPFLSSITSPCCILNKTRRCNTSCRTILEDHKHNFHWILTAIWLYYPCEGECINRRDSQYAICEREIAAIANKSHKACHRDGVWWRERRRCMRKLKISRVMISKHRLRVHAKSQFNGLIFALCHCWWHYSSTCRLADKSPVCKYQ